VKILALSLLLLLLAPGHAQTGKEDEASRILQRIEWFRQNRQLDRYPAAHLLRAAAVESLRASMVSRRGPLASWAPMGPSPMTMLSWTMGNVAGRVAAIAVDPNDSQVLYVGSASGGVWKTSNGGSSWTPIFSSIGTQTIGSLAIDASDHLSLWVGTGEHYLGCGSYFGMGVFHSPDGGISFQEANGSLPNRLPLTQVSALALHPGNSQIVLAGGGASCANGSNQGAGLFRTANGGSSWFPTSLTGKVEDILADPAQPGVFYAGSNGQGVFRSSDGGLTWNPIQTGLPTGSSMTRIRLAMAPSDPATLYALITSGSTILYKTTDEGTQWTTQNSSACEGQCWYDLCLDVHPSDPSRLLVGSIRFASSSNSGQTLSYLTSNWGSGQKVHQDTHVLLFNRNNGNQFWVGSDGGIWRSDDGGTNFVNINGNLNITELYDIAVHPSQNSKIFGGAQDNSSSRTDNNQLWNVTTVTGDGMMNLVDPLQPNNVFQTSYPSSGPSLIRSTTGGNPGSFSWLAMSGTVGSEPWPWVTPLAIQAHNGSTYLFIGSNRAYLSSDNGSNWIPLSVGALSTNTIRVIQPYSHGGSLGIYLATTGGRIFRCGDALAASPSWNEITSNYPSGPSASDIAIMPGNPEHLYVTRESFGAAQLYQSTNGGGHWDAVGNGIANNPANALAIDPLNPTRLFVATDVGMWESADGGLNFLAAMAGMPLGLPITDLEIDDDPHILSAASYGRGAWQLDLAAVLAVSAGLDVTACPNTWADLQAVVSNAMGTPIISWSVLSQPPGSSFSFLDGSTADPSFQADLPGDYELQVAVTANNGTATDTVTFHVGQDLMPAMLAAWPARLGEPGYDPLHDRDGSGAIAVLDLILQLAQPLCQ
jgi:hypothetical protein